MGEAKRKSLAERTIIYHHTSTLGTNLIWMSGVIELEGKSPPVIHRVWARSEPTRLHDEQ